MMDANISSSGQIMFVDRANPASKKKCLHVRTRCWERGRGGGYRRNLALNKGCGRVGGGWGEKGAERRSHGREA